MFGRGITQGRPVSSKNVPRCQPRICDQSCGSTLPPRNSPSNSRASSPTVMPCCWGWPACRRRRCTRGAAPGRWPGAAERVGPVEDDERACRPGGGLHAVVHRPDVGVEARARVLDVEDDGVDAGLGEMAAIWCPTWRTRRRPGSRCAGPCRSPRSRRPAPSRGSRARGRTPRRGRPRPTACITSTSWVRSRSDAGRVGHHADLLALELLVAARVQDVEAGLHAARPRRGGCGGERGERRRGSGDGDAPEHSSSCRHCVLLTVRSVTTGRWSEASVSGTCASTARRPGE